MEVSKLTISAETLNGPLMTKARKKKLREQIVMEYIQSKPAGARIITDEFKNICRFKHNGQTHNFINGMVKKGLINKDLLDGSRGRRYSYSVRTTKSPRPNTVVEKAITLGQEIEKHKAKEENMDIVAKAKQFAWERNSDSLRDFIATLQ